MAKVAAPLVAVRWHGRGGQGVVTASHLLAQTALAAGYHFQSSPEYGAERTGAPVIAYTRLSPDPIRERGQITEPDIVVVLDASLLGLVNVADGLRENGTLIVNAQASPKDVRRALSFERGRVFTVDASSIAMATLRRPIPNMPMLGAVVRATGLLSQSRVRDVLQVRLAERFDADTVRANLQAFELGYQGVQEG